MNVTTKTYMAGLRASKKTLASWAKKAKAAGMSFNKWAHLVLNNTPDVKPAEIVKKRPQWKKGRSEEENVPRFRRDE